MLLPQGRASAPIAAGESWGRVGWGYRPCEWFPLPARHPPHAQSIGQGRPRELLQGNSTARGSNLGYLTDRPAKVQTSCYLAICFSSDGTVQDPLQLRQGGAAPNTHLGLGLP